MLEEGWCRVDGMTLARSVRDIAKRAHLVLGRTGDHYCEARSVFDAIESLEKRLERGTATELGRWLASLRLLVEEQISSPV